MSPLGAYEAESMTKASGKIMMSTEKEQKLSDWEDELNDYDSEDFHSNQEGEDDEFDEKAGPELVFARRRVM